MANHEPETAIAAEQLLITASDLAHLLHISCRTLWRLNSADRVPVPVRLGNSVRWRIDEIRKWIADGCPNCKSRENKSLRR
jgi:predicted DNA-binding transcriptional regulator AlpA